MTPLFTMETSGHNPRPSKADRMRNRVSHKFSFYPERYDGFFSCVGCGRCVVSCPVSLDIRHMVQAAVEGATIEIKDEAPAKAPAAEVKEQKAVAPEAKVQEAAPEVKAPAEAAAPAPAVEAAPAEPAEAAAPAAAEKAAPAPKAQKSAPKAAPKSSTRSKAKKR